MGSLGWKTPEVIENRAWTCGYCGKDVGGRVGFRRDELADKTKVVYICPYCENPTAFIDPGNGDVEQIPGRAYGAAVGSLPRDVEAVYSECRRCVQYTAYTSAVLMLRKLIMHVAVDLGAGKDMPFVKYVGFLADNGHIPASAAKWVDALRSYGNEATHEVRMMGKDDAEQLLDFAEMLLRIVYEFPAKVRGNVT